MHSQGTSLFSSVGGVGRNQWNVNITLSTVSNPRLNRNGQCAEQLTKATHYVYTKQKQWSSAGNPFLEIPAVIVVIDHGWAVMSVIVSC